MPYIWSSVTLYNQTIREKRKTWFKEWLLATDEYSAETIRHFHKTAGDGNPAYSLVMNRNQELRTVSLTSIVHQNREVEMMYEDLLRQQLYHVTLTEAAITHY